MKHHTASGGAFHWLGSLVALFTIPTLCLAQGRAPDPADFESVEFVGTALSPRTVTLGDKKLINESIDQYLYVGVIYVRHKTRECRDRIFGAGCIDIVHNSNPTDRLMSEAGKTGADIVVLESDNVATVEQQTEERHGKCLREETEYTQVCYRQPSGLCDYSREPRRVCVSREILDPIVIAADHFVVSEGTLWRRIESLVIE